MLRNNARNGRWDGSGKNYLKGISFEDDDEGLKKFNAGKHFFDFEDGWEACVTVIRATADKKRKANEITEGFAGYDWMIDSIIE